MFNISFLSFFLSGLFSSLVAWQAFLVWKRQKSKLAETFLKALAFFSLYFISRAIASFFFAYLPDILTISYIVSHVFLGIAVAFAAKFGIVALDKYSWENRIFFIFIILYLSDVILNIFLPNTPRFNQELNIIEWGTHKYVGIYHTLLNWLGFFGLLIIFTYKAIKNWRNSLVRTRSLLIAFGLLVGIVLSIPRNIYRDPIFLLISDFSLALCLGIVLLGTSYGKERKEREKEE